MISNKIRILLVGKKSFISRNYKKFSKFNKTIDVISYKDIYKVNYKNYSHIFNLSLDPNTKTNNYNFTNKIDRKICKQIKDTKVIYILPSTRFVCEQNIKNNYYKINKIKIEKIVKKIKKPNYIILRIGNILAYDLDNKSLFITKILQDLKKKNVIKFNLKKNTYKDFITFEYFSKCLDILIEKKIVGTYNFSSGKKMNINTICKSLILGYGKGTIEYEKNLKNDSFVLDNLKLRKIVKIQLSKKKIIKYCYDIGRRLKNE